MENRLILEVMEATGLTQSQLARALKVTPASITKWLLTDYIPPRRCRDIEYLCDGKVTAEQLNPEAFKPRWYEKPRT